MRNVAVAFFLVALAAGAWWFFASGRDGTASEAEKQAAEFAMDAFGATVPPQPSQTAAANAAQPITNALNKKYMNATLHTNLGDIEIRLLDVDAPKTVANFTNLAEAQFYDGTKFHRVIKGFMIQGGDPLSKDDAMAARWGTGGPGYHFADEIHANNANSIGTIAMANAGPNTNGSQFFINVANNNFLDTKHTVFGLVTAGMDIVEKIQNVETGQADRPVTPVIIESISLK